jgi:hypothetical protein
MAVVPPVHDRGGDAREAIARFQAAIRAGCADSKLEGGPTPEARDRLDALPIAVDEHPLARRNVPKALRGFCLSVAHGGHAALSVSARLFLGLDYPTSKKRGAVHVCLMRSGEADYLAGGGLFGRPFFREPRRQPSR